MKDFNDLPGWDVGEVVITAEAPAGSNPRNNEDFEQVEEQINRLVDIHEHKAVDWSQVAILAEKILRNQGKDLSVAVWFLVARMHTDKLTGLAIGIHVLKEVVCQYWQEMSPPLRRMRARRNIIYWLFDQLKDYLEKEPEPIDNALQQQLMADWKALEEQWQKNDEDEAPPFFGLKRTFESLPVKESPEPQKTNAVTNKDNHLEKDTGGHVALTEERHLIEKKLINPPSSQVENDQVESDQVESDQVESDQVESDQVESDQVESDQVENDQVENDQVENDQVEATDDTLADSQPFLSKTAFEENPVDAIDNALDSLGELINWGLSSDSISPLFFRLNRVFAWATVDSLPLSQNNQTYLPAPTQQLMTSWEKVLHQGDAQSQIHFAESRLSSCRFWLDLNRFSYEALLATEQVEAADTVKAELVQLINRIPNIAELTFSNGQPFADDKTTQWILDITLPKENNNAQSSVIDNIDSYIQQVLLDSNKSNVAFSLEKLQAATQRTSSLREVFRLQTAQLELLVKNRCCVDSAVFISPLLDSLEKYHLIEWEPQLSISFLTAAIQLISLDPKAKSNQKKTLLRYLSSVSIKDTWEIYS